MTKMRTELQDQIRREAFVENRLYMMGILAFGDELHISLRKAVKQEYLNRIDDGLRHPNSWIDGDMASFERSIKGIERYLLEYAAGYDAGYRGAYSQN